MITQEVLDQIESGATVTISRDDFDLLVEIAQVWIDTEDFLCVTRAEYDKLVERSHRLEKYEPGPV